MTNPRARTGQEGFSLAAFIILVTILSVLGAAAVPVLTTEARRELEEELIFRGEEYIRAIQKYQRQFGVYPPDIEALLESNETRFLRREYVDPFTGEPFRLIKANPDGTLEGSRIYEFEDLPLMGGPLGSGIPAGAGPGSAAPPAIGAGGAGAGRGGRGGGDGGRGGGDGGRGGGGGGRGVAGGVGGFGNNAQFPAAFPGAGQNAAGSSGPTTTAAPPLVSALPGFGAPGGGAAQGGGLGNFGQQPGGNFGVQAGGRGAGGGGRGDGGGGRGDGGGGRGGGGGGRGGGRGGGTPGTLAGSLIGGSGGGRGGGVPAGANAAISGVVGVAPNNEAASLKVYNDRDIYAEWEFIALQSAIAPGETTGLMPGEENNSGQPNPFGR
jgi:type II secretory pathway pseudopilin PulG